jgi:hypothetical protein
VSCYSLPDLIEFLASLNPAFCDYDPTEGPLLRPEQVVELCGDCGRNVTARTLSRLRREGAGPDYVQFNVRVYRYRLKDVLRWLQDPKPKPKPLALSELIMRRL